MTREQAKEEIPNFDSFVHITCVNCANDWFCPTLCEALEKAKRLPLEKIQKAYARHDGDMLEVFRYIQKAR